MIWPFYLEDRIDTEGKLIITQENRKKLGLFIVEYPLQDNNVV